ncbi:molybdopterin molybdotransferase MoeA [Lacisediminihabitans profunda]|uniref:Molybdopterin molybdenumtransferase n=1 Tax=Lacisediminihabitans profunda TaxID=2594790 RepID=A0A5C8UVM5_9MICO|nr:molybdopterin molybdotransferase MoeA [Lacisediminihabitans profunda]TXN32072.1 molybdopterin molybdotransferase MoeA [Lacisediminihabitans profunda]
MTDGPGGRAVAWHAARTLASAATALPAETVPLDEAVGRVLAADVLALCDLPHYASSAMDGWAVSGEGPWAITTGALSPGMASVVQTGGLLPDGADAVLRSESGSVRDQSGRLVLSSTTDEPRPAQHIRAAGDEARLSDLLIAAGTLINPAHIAVAAAGGHDELGVIRRPRIALLLTGDEVVESGIPAPGQVRDSFGPQLPAVLGMLGGAVVSDSRVRDDLAATIAALGDAQRDSDLVITTGGTGDSAVDHIHAALRSIGAEVLVPRVAMRPGGPSLLARLPDGRLLVGLPGNPLAAMMGLLTLVEPVLAALGGRPKRLLGSVTSADSLPGRAGSSILVPYRVLDGRAVANPWLGSGMMRGLAEAAGVLIVPPAGVRAGGTAETVALPWG